MRYIFAALLYIFAHHALAQRGISSVFYQSTLPEITGVHDAKIIFSENFDTQAMPAGWTQQVKQSDFTWIFTNQVENPFSNIISSSKSSAFCHWAKTRSGQDEWLISPRIEVGDFKSLYCDFYAGFSRTWVKNATLRLYIGEPSASDTIWTLAWDAATSKDTLGNNWQWHPTRVNVSKYINKGILLSWRYTGNDGDLVGLDQVTVTGGTASMETDILTFSITRQAKASVIDTLANKINIELLAYTDTTKLIPTFSLSAGAYSIPKSKDIISVSTTAPYEIKVFAADSTTFKIWELHFTIASVSKDADITGFTVVGQTQKSSIDVVNGIIRLEVPCTQDLTKVRPTITLSPGASIFPTSGILTQFEDGIAKEYLVTAQDTAYKRKWLVYVTVRDYRSEVLSFSVPSQSSASVVDTIENKIYVELAYGTNLNTIVPTFTLTDCGISEPVSGEMLMIQQGVPLVLKIIPKNKEAPIQTYEVYFSVSKNFLMRQSFDADTLVEQAGWMVLKSNTQTWTISNQPRVPFRIINRRSTGSAMCPWSETTQDEWLISPWVQTQYIKESGYNDLTLEYYLGFNPKFFQPNTSISIMLRRDEFTWQRVWQLPTENTNPETWQWNKYNISLDGWLGDSVQIAFVYTGVNGDLAGLDDVILFSDPIDNISTKKFEEILVYPNPASDVIYLPETMDDTFIHAQFFGTDGRKFAIKQVESNSLNISDLQSGFYFIIITTQEGNLRYIKLRKE